MARRERETADGTCYQQEEWRRPHRDYRKACITCGDWCVKDRRLLSNPFAGVPKAADAKANTRRKHQALTGTEWVRLLDVAEAEVRLIGLQIVNEQAPRQFRRRFFVRRRRNQPFLCSVARIPLLTIRLPLGMWVQQWYNSGAAGGNSVQARPGPAWFQR